MGLRRIDVVTPGYSLFGTEACRGLSLPWDEALPQVAETANMYKRKLFFFGLATALLLSIALICIFVSAQLTKQNLKQNGIAQSLLNEHQMISSLSYRMFKQLTDELIFGQAANQAEVRKKHAIIEQSFINIKRLEREQREALGVEITQGSVEDTDELQQLLRDILDEFRQIVRSDTQVPLEKRDRLQRLLEVTIDNQFREAINAAVARQSRVVAALSVRIETLNTAMLWFTVALGVVSFPLIIFGCYWLFNQLYQPLELIRNATNAIAEGNYRAPLTETMDTEFNELATAINQLAERLQEHESKEAQSRERLEVEVQQRTSELTQANLALTKIDTRRRQFIADVSHELRTPLTIIRGEAQVTLRQQSASEQDYRATLDAILQQAVGLSTLVDDLLLLTRAEMNQLSLDIAPVDLGLLLADEVNKWQRLHGDRHIIMDMPPALENARVLVDKPRIEQVLSILLDNAIKYSSPGADVSVLAEQRAGQIRIAVKDNGRGISAAEIENIFERFVRFSKQKEGLGLGLPIAKVIVETHGGQIGVESVQGDGSLFWFSLPLEGSV